MEMDSLDGQMRRKTCHIPCNKLVSTCRRLTVFAAIPLLPQRGSGGATSLFLAHAAQRPFSHSKPTPAARAHASPLDCHWTARLLDPEANACEMEPSNRTNDRHSGSSNLLPSPGGIPAAGGTRLVMEGSFGLCLDHARPCRQHGSFISGPSRSSLLLNHPPRHTLAHRCLWSGVGGGFMGPIERVHDAVMRSYSRLGAARHDPHGRKTGR
jgi:hypothetical protein